MKHPMDPTAPYMGRPGGPTNQDIALAGKRELEAKGQWGTTPLPPGPKYLRKLRWRRWVRAIFFGLVVLFWAAAALANIRSGGVNLWGSLVLVAVFAPLALDQGGKAINTKVPASR